MAKDKRLTAAYAAVDATKAYPLAEVIVFIEFVGLIWVIEFIFQ